MQNSVPQMNISVKFKIKMKDWEGNDEYTHLSRAFCAWHNINRGLHHPVEKTENWSEIKTKTDYG